MLNIFKKNTIFGRNTNSDLPLYYDNITVEGKTTQETRSGKNLLNPNILEAGNIDTSTGENSYGNARRTNDYINVTSGQVYSFQYKTTSTNKQIVVYEYSSSKSYIGFQVISNLSGSITLSSTTAYIKLRFSGDYSVQSSDIYDVQVEKSNNVTEYEPYGAMPSPDYPSDLVSVGYENLFDIESWVNSGNNSNYYSYNNGVLSINALDTRYFSLFTEADKLYLPNGTYYLSNIGNASIRVYNDDTDANVVSTNQFEVTLGYIYLKLVSSTQMTCQPMITKGTQSHSYIPYGKYGIEVKTTGKNLFDKTKAILNKGVNTSNGNLYNDNNCFTTDFIEVNSNGVYYTANGYSSTANRVYGAQYDNNKQYVGSIATNVGAKTFYISNTNTKYIRLTGLTSEIDTYQLEQGSIVTTYKPYIGHTNLIVLDNPLRSIGNTKDLLYIKNGMLYVDRKIGSIVLNGSENWAYYENMIYVDGLINDYLKTAGTISLSNYYKGSSNSTTTAGSYDNGNNTISFRIGDTLNRLLIRDDRYTGIVNFKSWLSTHNTEVQYELATPTIETYELDIQPMIFDSLGYGTLSDVVSDPLITEELNGSYILELEYMKNGKFSEYLVEENIIKAHGEPFSIYSVEKDTDEKIKILAKHWVINEWDKDFILDSAPTDLTAQNALAWIQQRSINHSDISISGDCTTTSTARYVRKNMLSAIFKEDNAILTRFGGELSYNKNNVSVNKHRGSLSGLTIRQGKNLTGAKYYLDFSTVTTRLVPVGKDGLMLDEMYVDSPLINNYVTSIIRKVEVNTTSKDELRSYCNKLYENGLDKPTVSIKIDFIELSKTDEYKQYSSLETAHLGDEVTAYIPSLNLNVSTRIVKTVYNDNLKRITALELGSVTPNIATSSVNVEKNLQKQVEQLAANDSLILDEAKEEASNLIKHPFGGYIYIDDTTGNMYIMDTNNINTAQNVWRWGLGGLGFSSTGVNGTYGIAMTQDGKIVADYIKSGTLQSVTIKATNGTVGGYKIGENKLYAETYSSYNFDSSDLTAIRNYLMDEGSLSDDELIKYDIDGNGVVDSRDYVLIRNFIELGVTKNKSAKIIMQTGNNIFENAYILQDANENDILNINFNGFMYDHPNNGKFNLSGSKLTLTDINNNSMTISPDWLPKSVLSNWYSTSSTTLTDAKKHKLLVILGKPTSSSGIVSLIIPTDALSTSNQQFQCADESKYVAFNVRYNNDDVIITGAGRSSDGSILSAWTLL